MAARRRRFFYATPGLPRTPSLACLRRVQDEGTRNRPVYRRLRRVPFVLSIAVLNRMAPRGNYGIWAGRTRSRKISSLPNGPDYRWRLCLTCTAGACVITLRRYWGTRQEICAILTYCAHRPKSVVWYRGRTANGSAISTWRPRIWSQWQGVAWAMRRFGLHCETKRGVQPVKG